MEWNVSQNAPVRVRSSSSQTNTVTSKENLENLDIQLKWLDLLQIPMNQHWNECSRLIDLHYHKISILEETTLNLHDLLLFTTTWNLTNLHPNHQTGTKLNFGQFHHSHNSSTMIKTSSKFSKYLTEYSILSIYHQKQNQSWKSLQ